MLFTCIFLKRRDRGGSSQSLIFNVHQISHQLQILKKISMIKKNRVHKNIGTYALMYLLNSGDPDVIFGMYSFKKKAGNGAYF